MAHSEWGSKRLCQECGTKFYDFARKPIVCPKCGTEVVVASALKPRRNRAAVKAVETKAVAKKAPPVVAEAVKDVEDLELEVVDDELDVIADDADEDEDALIEDPSDLGGDDDMSDVIVADTDDED